MTLRSSDLQSDSDLDSIRNSCDVFVCNQQIEKQKSHRLTEEGWWSKAIWAMPIYQNQHISKRGSWDFYFYLPESEVGCSDYFHRDHNFSIPPASKADWHPVLVPLLEIFVQKPIHKLRSNINKSTHKLWNKIKKATHKLRNNIKKPIRKLEFAQMAN